MPTIKDCNAPQYDVPFWDGYGAGRGIASNQDWWGVQRGCRLIGGTIYRPQHHPAGTQGLCISTLPSRQVRVQGLLSFSPSTKDSILWNVGCFGVHVSLSSFLRALSIVPNDLSPKWLSACTFIHYDLLPPEHLMKWASHGGILFLIVGNTLRSGGWSTNLSLKLS